MSLRAPAALAGAAGLVALVFVSTAIAAPPGVDSGAAAGAEVGADEPAEVTIVATEFSFDAPDRMPAGAVAITLVNEGDALHHAQLIRLADDRTPADLAEAMADGTVPDWAELVGGPALVMPGMRASATVDLRPGTYYVTCLVESEGEDGPVTHMAEGMIEEVTVEPGPREPLPEADNIMMLNDYSFKMGKPLHAGHQVVRVRNYAAQPHEVVLVRLDSGKTMDDLLAWMASDGEGPPPGMPVGGMQALSQGQAGNLVLDLEPGDYGLICFVPDAGDGEPHFVHGMVDQITVQ